ncbi:hypothetical protein QL996_05690 [Planococcus sp. APC 4015]|nr:hypothetical protein [Planococcus sp. APC 4015]
MTTTELIALSDDIERWARVASFRSSDDIPRMRRSPEWLPDFTPDSVERRRVELARFRERLAGIDLSAGDVAAAVDARLLGSVLDRVEWDLDVLRNWERDAVFLVGQILGPWFDLLLPRPPFTADVERGLVVVAQSIPERVALARANLERAGVGDLARAAALELEGIDARFRASVDGLESVVAPEILEQLRASAPEAGRALAGFSSWLQESAAVFAPSAGSVSCGSCVTSRSSPRSRRISSARRSRTTDVPSSPSS